MKYTRSITPHKTLGVRTKNISITMPQYNIQKNTDTHIIDGQKYSKALVKWLIATST